MDNYVQVTFKNVPPDLQEILIAYLSDVGYDGFEQGEIELKAFILERKFDNGLIKELADRYELSCASQNIASQNWNALWESNFSPVTIDNFVAIRADFHPPFPGIKREIIITPKMSFGTGHHATTKMMIRQMSRIDFAGKSVLDFGTGTGVLAILSHKLGARKIVAIDNDEWSILNAKENVERNNCEAIEIIKADSIPAEGSFDIILANINKNVILDHFNLLVSRLNTRGYLILSGFLTEDESIILSYTREPGLEIESKEVDSKWLCISLSHP